MILVARRPGRKSAIAGPSASSGGRAAILRPPGVEAPANANISFFSPSGQPIGKRGELAHQGRAQERAQYSGDGAQSIHGRSPGNAGQEGSSRQGGLERHTLAQQFPRVRRQAFLAPDPEPQCRKRAPGVSRQEVHPGDVGRLVDNSPPIEGPTRADLRQRGCRKSATSDRHRLGAMLVVSAASSHRS